MPSQTMQENARIDMAIPRLRRRFSRMVRTADASPIRLQSIPRRTAAVVRGFTGTVPACIMSKYASWSSAGVGLEPTFAAIAAPSVPVQTTSPIKRNARPKRVRLTAQAGADDAAWDEATGKPAGGGGGSTAARYGEA